MTSQEFLMMILRRTTVLLLLCLLAPNKALLAQLPGEYLLAVHGCDPNNTNCKDPRNHSTYLLYSNDGASWQVLPGFTSFKGSVPDLVRRGDTLYVYTPQTLRRYHIKSQRWDPPVRVKLNDPKAPWGYVDPSLLIDDQGRLVILYLPGDLSGHLGRCPPNTPSCVKEFRSAVEAPDSDGAIFEAVAGTRVAVKLSQGQGAWDPDWFFDGQRYVAYISHGQSIQVYTSPTLHGSYALHTKLKDGMLVRGFGGVPCGHFDPTTQRYWTYAHTRVNGQEVVRRAVHATLDQELKDHDFQVVVQGTTLGTASSRAESPAITVNFPHMGKAQAYGSACGSPELASNGRAPVLGSSVFGLELEKGDPGRVLALAFGAARTSVDLSVFGWPACRLQAHPDLVLGGTIAKDGSFAVTLPIPNNKSLLDKSLHTQAIIASVPGTASAGITVTIGRM
jgi:hypothetical protein